MNNNCNNKSSSEFDSANELNSDVKNPESQDDISIYKTYAIAAQISNIGFEMIIPLLLGVGLDYLLGTVVVFAIIGTISGFAIAFWQLIKISNRLK
ncbi:MAG: AtpZ/AtpI family protein [Planctomycetaceae bacterium]|jgi:F0F1-type ATP synthase assembly protein I|nr:AtpZ/AtpI family protein [Planctomycetaceae bacterium]